MIIPKNPLQGYFKSYVSNFPAGQTEILPPYLIWIVFAEFMFFRGKISLFAADATPLYYTGPIYSFDIL